MYGLIQMIAMNEEAQRCHEEGIKQPPVMLLKDVDYGSERFRQAYEKMQKLSTLTTQEEK
jgi:hypothetical protein